MASTNQKPLPSIPRRSDIPQHMNLTVEGREHLRRLIRMSLSEEDQPFLSDGGSDSWANAMESAIDMLGDNIVRGGWLTGVKRARMARKAMKAEELKKLEAKGTKKELEEIGKSKGKGKGDVSEGPPPREDKELPKSPPSSVTAEEHEGPGLALRQIRDLAARPMLPSPKPYAKHLLLCLVPIGRPLPSEDGGFDLVPNNTDCTFTPGFFSLPEALSDNNEESGILFGLNEWDGW
jgi:1-phosphatidylinositol-3-phosphate 5-kinase